MQKLIVTIQMMEKQLSFKISSFYIDEINLRRVALSTTNANPAGARSRFLMFHQQVETLQEVAA
jgi:hypothetical protein